MSGWFAGCAWFFAVIGWMIALGNGKSDAVIGCYAVATFWMAAAAYYRLGEHKP